MSRMPPIRVGDQVRIVQPEIFERCGYPLDVRVLAQQIDPQIVRQAFIAAGVKVAGTDEWPPIGLLRSAYLRVCRGLALAQAKQQRFGGPERRVYTRTVPELAGRVVAVSGTRRVVSGVRVPGSSPYLEGMQHHVLLRFLPPRIHLSDQGLYLSELGEFEIQRCHVERVKW